MSLEANKAIARRFIVETLDGGRMDVVREIFNEGAVRHFPPGDVIVDSSQNRLLVPRRSMRTDIHKLYGEGDFVTVHLTHHAEFGPDTQFRTRAGPVDVSDKQIAWDAIVILRFEDGKIAEEWVVRDELHIVLQAGVTLRP
jgi:predicted SnoaL-like aldol condensation-catalyzing enzyme